jgi:5'-nucleotidase
MMLRQYFLSLKVLGKWSGWSPSLGRHWGRIHSSLHDTHPVKESHSASGTETPRTTRVSLEQAGVVGGASDEPLDEEEIAIHEETPSVPEHVSQKERELELARKVMRKWWRLAKLPGHPRLCDEMGEGEFKVNWTKVIARP